MKADKQAIYSHSASQDITLEDVRDFWWTYRRLTIACLLLFVVLASAYCLLATRRWGASGQLEIDKSDVSSLANFGSNASDTKAGSGDSLDFTLTQQTQVNIIQSDSLILQVIQELDLEPTSDFFPQKGHGFIPHWILFWRKPLQPLTVPLNDAPNRRATAIRLFNAHLKVKMVGGTRLISITYFSPDPQIAAAVVNHLIDDYANFAFEARLKQTEAASGWLTGQLHDLKTQTQELQAKSIRLQRETGLFGENEENNIVLARLEALNTQVTAAESNRILKESIYNEVQHGNAELISGLNGNSMDGTTGPMQSSLMLIQNLRTQEAQVRAQLADFRSRYGDSHPKMIQLTAQLNDLEGGIKQEEERIAGRAKTDYEIAAQKEHAARLNLEDQEKIANELNDKATAYALARREADDSRNLYADVMSKLKQAGILRGLRASDVIVVDPGRIPPPNNPEKPNLLLIYGAALVVGMFVGLMISLFIFIGSLRFQTMEDVQRPGLHVDGILPETMSGGSLLQRVQRYLRLPAKPVIKNIIPENAAEFHEGLMALRTSIMRPYEDKMPQIIVTTSPLPAADRRAISQRLGELLAEGGARTLFVDANLRGSPVATAANPFPRLTDLLKQEEFVTSGFPEVHPNFYQINSGSHSSTAPTQLASARMSELMQTWRSQYQFVIIDVPAVLPFTDATIVSQFADLVLLFVRHANTPKASFMRAELLLSEALSKGARLGVVFHAVPTHTPEYRNTYGVDNRKDDSHA